MPLVQAQPDALSATYARSLFELAQAGGGQEQIETCLGELDEILELSRQNPTFGEFLASRVLPLKTRAKSLNTIFKDSISDLTLRFLQVLNAKERLGHLYAIVASFDALVQESFGRIEVDVFTTSPISPEQLKAIRDRLGSILSKEVIVHPYTDASMLGGVRLRIGDQLVDGSLATRLHKMRDQLATQGLAQLRARADDIIQIDETDTTN